MDLNCIHHLGLGLFRHTLCPRNHPEKNRLNIESDSLITVIRISYLGLFLAEKQNIKTMGGLGMLLYQAVPAFEALYGKKPSVSVGLRRHIAEHILRVGK